MGCAQSKTVEIDGVKVQEKPKRVSKKVAHPSDIDNEHTALTSGLIHRANVSQMHEKYDTSKAAELGRGACGSVVAVRRKDTNDMFAMKTVTLESMGCANFDELLVELNVQKRLDHPNIARIIESFEDERHGVMYIVMELCAGGSLVSRMRKHRHGYTERMAATIIEKTLSAIVYCHHHGVVHRDIKLDNIMYEKDSDDGELKLIDFGFAMEVKRGAVSMWDQLGTPSYMAPELWQVREVTAPRASSFSFSHRTHHQKRSHTNARALPSLSVMLWLLFTRRTRSTTRRSISTRSASSPSSYSPGAGRSTTQTAPRRSG